MEVEEQIVYLNFPHIKNDDVKREVVKKIINVFNTIREQHVSRGSSDGKMTTVADIKSLLDFIQTLEQCMPFSEHGIDPYKEAITESLMGCYPAYEQEAVYKFLESEGLYVDFDQGNQQQAASA